MNGYSDSDCPDPIVFIVDDDTELSCDLKRLLESVGLKVTTYSCAEDFLEAYPPGHPGCLLLDVYLPDMNGLELQQKLRDYGIELPVVIVTAHGDVSTAVTAMKNGALDFIEKPFNEQQLLDCVQNSLVRSQTQYRMHSYQRLLKRRFSSLTPREWEVMLHVVRSISNKVIAKELDVSRKTVEVHRANVMKKMHTTSLSELIQMAITTGVLEDTAKQFS